MARDATSAAPRWGSWAAPEGARLLWMCARLGRAGRSPVGPSHTAGACHRRSSRTWAVEDRCTKHQLAPRVIGHCELGRCRRGVRWVARLASGRWEGKAARVVVGLGATWARRSRSTWHPINSRLNRRPGLSRFFAWLTSHGSSNQELRQPGRGRRCAASWAMAERLSSVKPVLEAQPASATTQCIHAIHASTPGGQTAPCGPTRCQHTTAEHADKRYIDGAEPFRPRVTCCTPRTPLPKSPVKRTFPHLSRSSSREAPLSRRRVERERQRPSPGRIQPRQRSPARSLASRGRTGQPQGKMGGGWLLLACRHAESLTPHPSATQAVCCPTAGTWNGVSQASARYC